MSPTELKLFAIYKCAAVPVGIIAEDYFGISPKTAAEYAALYKLPIPAFRLTASQKAPWMVKVSDLAQHIDKSGEEAAKTWDHCQV